MADAIQVDGAGLCSHAEVCDNAAKALPRSAPPAAGHLTQASTTAVQAGHAMVDTVAARLVARAVSTGQKLRVADGVYRSTDSVSARNLGAVAGPVQA